MDTTKKETDLPFYLNLILWFTQRNSSNTKECEEGFEYKGTYQCFILNKTKQTKKLTNPNISLWQRTITDYTRTLQALDVNLYMRYNLIYAKN